MKGKFKSNLSKSIAMLINNTNYLPAKYLN